MSRQTTSNAQQKKVLRRPTVFFGTILFLLLFILSVVCGCSAAKNAALNDFHTPADHTSNGQNKEKNAATLLQKDGVTYVCAQDVSQSVTQLSPTLFEVKLNGGDLCFFSTQVSDFFKNNKLGYLNNLPYVSEEKLFLPLSAVEETLTKEAAENAFTTVIATVSAAPSLPADLSAQEYFNILTQTPALKLDHSAYESYINPANRDGYLVLANATHALDKDYVPQNMVYVERARYSEPNYRAKLVESAAKSLDAFLREAYAVGYNDITVTSGYRSYADQEFRFNTKVNSLRGEYNTLEAAQAAAATVIQWPGKSEHQTALACDMHNLPAASTDFAKTEAATWLRENAHNFGFILRYPEDKTEITGISFEPWHFRFVGRYHATRIHLLNLTLEEYVEFFNLVEV